MLQFLKAISNAFRPGRPLQPYSMVLLMNTPFHQSGKFYADAATQAFGVAYDGSDEMHFVNESPNCIFLKAGWALISIRPKWGAYLGKNGEDDVETGAALLPEEQRRWWRKQRAWVAFDLQNSEKPESSEMQVLAKLLLELVDERCCGVWIPRSGRFLPNDGTAIAELTRLSLT
jgi:hypothetical protein